MKRRGAAIGTFDGVHRGHKSVLKTLTDLCSLKGLEPVAITFDRHPLAHIDPSRMPPSLTLLPKKKELLNRNGVMPVVYQFNEDLRCLTAEQWMLKIRDELGVDLLVIGYDNTFGCDGINLSLNDYRNLGKKLGIEVVEAPELKGISSSAIRKAIRAGHVDKAAEMADRLPSVSGIVVPGNKLGRSLGFPTANLQAEEGIAIPGNGVYAAQAVLPAGERFPAMVNIGTRPTVRRGMDTVIEAHIIGWQGDLYGKKIKLRFIARLRDEIKFDSIEDLKRQLEEDRQNTLKKKL